MKSALIYWCFNSILLVIAYVQEFSMNNMRELDNDLHIYIKSLNKVADFFLAHNHYVSEVVDFGVFLQNVNLRSVLNEKGRNLPDSLRIELKRLIRKNRKIIGLYKKRSVGNPAEVKTLTSLFSNENFWISNLKNFNSSNGNERPFVNHNAKFLRSRYSSWENYLNTSDIYEGNPTPRESDTCLFHLGLNPVKYVGHTKQCTLPEFCRQYMHSGLGRGYSLTHRLLLLHFARFARHCHVISAEKDIRIGKKLCASIYSESLYIQLNNYKAFDLLMEQIVLCALNGHSEFIKRRWLVVALGTQTKEGCFPNSLDLVDVNDSNHLMLHGRCDGHTTILVSAALASAIRFILEKFY